MTMLERAVALAYGLGCTLYLHPDGRIRVLPEDESAEWQRIEPAPGAAPTAYGHGRDAEAQVRP